MNSRLKLIVILHCLCAATATYAQTPCALKSITGTYAFYEKGSSSILVSPSTSYNLHWEGDVAPFVAVGEVTFGTNGVGEGLYWIRMGYFNAGPDPTPVEMTITELNPDCTGKWQFDFDLLGTTYTIEERFILFDNGRQIRSVPISTGLPTMAWIGEARRISKPDQLLGNCGPNTANGTYLLTAENLVRLSTNPIFSDAVMLRLVLSKSGSVDGVLYEKYGPKGNIQLPVSGTITVNSDCTFASNLSVTVMGNPATIPMRGVFFDEGKKVYALNVNTNTMGTQYSFGQGERIGPSQDQ